MGPEQNNTSFIAKEYVRRLGDLSLFPIQDQLAKAIGRTAWIEVRRWQEVQLRTVRLIGRFYRQQAHKRKIAGRRP